MKDHMNRVIIGGPRGGRYVVVNGRKRYLPIKVKANDAMAAGRLTEANVHTIGALRAVRRNRPGRRDVRMAQHRRKVHGAAVASPPSSPRLRKILASASDVALPGVYPVRHHVRNVSPSTPPRRNARAPDHRNHRNHRAHERLMALLAMPAPPRAYPRNVPLTRHEMMLAASGAPMTESYRRRMLDAASSMPLPKSPKKRVHFAPLPPPHRHADSNHHASRRNTLRVASSTPLPRRNANQGHHADFFDGHAMLSRHRSMLHSAALTRW